MEKIKDLITDLKNDSVKFNGLHKEFVFNFLLKLKQNSEFNGTVDFKEVYKDICDIYGNKNPLYMNTIFTPDPIDKDSMGENDIFVFGSNTEGNHAGGAARVAVNYYGAIMGQARGLQGNSYGVVTLDYTKEHSITLLTISQEIDNLVLFALDNPELTFHLTKIGCGISNYEIKDIASLFNGRIIPKNLILPYEFVFPNKFETHFYSKSENKYYKIKSEEEMIVLTQNKDTSVISKQNVRNELPTDVFAIDEDVFTAVVQSTIKRIYQ